MGVGFKDKNDKARFDVLVQHHIMPTRYIDESCLITIVLLNYVNLMFIQLGWRNFCLSNIQHMKESHLSF